MPELLAHPLLGGQFFVSFAISKLSKHLIGGLRFSIPNLVSIDLGQTPSAPAPCPGREGEGGHSPGATSLQKMRPPLLDKTNCLQKASPLERPPSGGGGTPQGSHVPTYKGCLFTPDSAQSDSCLGITDPRNGTLHW